MLISEQAKSLFQMQADLVDAKVEVAVSRAIVQAVDQMIRIRQEIHRDFNALRHEVHQEISSVKHQLSQMEGRLSNVESALGLRKQVRGEIRNQFFDYAFKTGWLIGSVALLYWVTNFHNLFPSNVLLNPFNAQYISDLCQLRDHAAK